MDALAGAVLRDRLAAQLLTRREALDPVDVVGRITAVQAQDPRGFRLAVRARTTLPSVAALEARLADRSLVVDWLNRGTLHLVRADDHAWLHSLTAPRQLTSNARRLGQEGVTPDAAERGVAVVSRAVREDGPHTRAQLRELLDAAGVRTQGQTLVHVLGLASLRGLLLRGPVVDGGEQAFVDPVSWLGPRPALPDRDVLLAELARRYLAGHGPADDRDLAAWSGLPLGDVRRGLAGVRGAVAHDDGRVSLGAAAEPDLPAPVLLGPFDPVLHGWASRELVVPAGGVGVVTDNGIFRPIALVGGRAVATWRLEGGAPRWEVLAGEQLSPEIEEALRADALAVTAWLAAASAPTSDG